MNNEADIAGIGHDELHHRSRLVTQAIPTLFIPVAATFGVGILVRLALGDPPRRLHESGHGPPDLLGPIVVLLVFCTALVMLVRLGRPRLSALLMIGGWTLVTALSTLSNSVTTIAPALLIIPICAAGLLFDGIASVSLAGLATLLVVSMSILEARGLIPPHDVRRVFQLPLFAASYWVGIFWTVAALTSLLAGHLQRTLQQSRSQAHALHDVSMQLEARVAIQTAELAQRTARAEALHEVSRALARTLDLAQVLALIAEQAAHLLRFDNVLVLLAQPDDQGFTVEGSYPHSASAHNLQSNWAEHLVPALAHDQPVVLSIPSDEPSGLTDQSAALIIPLRYRNVVTGGLVLIEQAGSAERSADDLKLAEGFADHAAVAIANAQLLAQSREAAVLEERTRLAREMHDTLAQGLTGIVVQLGAAQRALKAAPDEMEQHLMLAQRMAREALTEARGSVWNLRTPALQQGDLVAALRSLVARPFFSKTEAHFEQSSTPWDLPPAVETALLRVCQEALTNVAKHAQATCVLVQLDYLPDVVRLIIHDNGRGIDPRFLNQPVGSASHWNGFGLIGMRERINALGGVLNVSNAGGARVQAVVPRTRWEDV